MKRCKHNWIEAFEGDLGQDVCWSSSAIKRTCSICNKESIRYASEKELEAETSLRTCQECGCLWTEHGEYGNLNVPASCLRLLMKRVSLLERKLDNMQINATFDRHSDY